MCKDVILNFYLLPASSIPFCREGTLKKMISAAKWERIHMLWHICKPMRRQLSVTTDRSEARVDPLTALLVQGQTGKYQAGVSRAT